MALEAEMYLDYVCFYPRTTVLSEKYINAYLTMTLCTNCKHWNESEKRGTFISNFLLSSS